MVFSFHTTAEEVATAFKAQISGKNVLVTGVSPKSLGAETVRVIAPYAKTIIVASRSRDRSFQVIDATLKEAPNADFKFVELDLTSEESIRAAGAAVIALDIPINVVINNAAVTPSKELRHTKQGFEYDFGANHLGHFLFNSLIVPAILRTTSPSSTDPARIVTVGSAAALWVKGIRWEDPSYTKNPEEYEKYNAYGVSKYANTAYTTGLAKRLGPKGVLALCLHPGGILETNMGSAPPKEELIAMGFMDADGKLLFPIKTLQEGTATQVAAAFDPSFVGHNGAFIEDSVIMNDKTPAAALTEEEADKLWELSEKMWGAKF